MEKSSRVCDKKKKTVKTGLKILNYRSPQSWSVLPENLRLHFKQSVRKWDCIDSMCRLCKLYLPNIGIL